MAVSQLWMLHCLAFLDNAFHIWSYPMSMLSFFSSFTPGSGRLSAKFQVLSSTFLRIRDGLEVEAWPRIRTAFRMSRYIFVWPYSPRRQTFTSRRRWIAVLLIESLKECRRTLVPPRIGSSSFLETSFLMNDRSLPPSMTPRIRADWLSLIIHDYINVYSSIWLSSVISAQQCTLAATAFLSPELFTWCGHL